MIDLEFVKLVAVMREQQKQYFKYRLDLDKCKATEKMVDDYIARIRTDLLNESASRQTELF